MLKAAPDYDGEGSPPREALETKLAKAAPDVPRFGWFFHDLPLSEASPQADHRTAPA